MAERVVVYLIREGKCNNCGKVAIGMTIRVAYSDKIGIEEVPTCINCLNLHIDKIGDLDTIHQTEGQKAS